MANEIKISNVRPSTAFIPHPDYGPEHALDCDAKVNGVSGTLTFVERRSGQGYEAAGDSVGCWMSQEIVDALWAPCQAALDREEHDEYARLSRAQEDTVMELAAAGAAACDRYVW